MKKTGNSAMTEKNQNIQVFVRCRPLNNQEKKNNFHTPVEVNPDKKEILIKEKPQDKFTKKFTFDKVFGPQAKQVDVYKSVVGPLLEEVLMGYNCTVFAYGQTGTGKTHTMEGERVTDESRPWDEDPGIGIIPRSLKQLFEELQQTDVEYSVRVSFMELYNEELFDLLTSIEDNSKLRLFEDVARKGSVIIQNLEEVVVTCIEDVYSVLQRGSQKRQTAATLMNAHSSRSHSVFSVTVHIKENNIDGEELLKTGKLNLVDLAGSENIGRSGATEKRAREAGNINQSLLTLGRVITALVEKAPHIPYRESKLTRLLQDSLGGRTKTSIIATISPSLCNLEETLSTLDYAHRAKNITNRPEVNQKMTKKALLRAYTEEIDRLRRDLIAAREKNGIFVDEENYNATQMQLVQQTCEIKEKLTWIESLEEEINKKNELIEEIKKELSCKSYRLQVTEETLEKTAEDLLNTQKVLTATTQDRNEQKYLVDEHQQKETILLNQAEELISVVHQTTSDVNGLHEKIQRKQNVEHQNKNILDEFEKKLNHSVCEIEEKICKFAEIQSNDFNNLHSVIEQETVHTCENISMMKVIMKNLKYQYLMEKEQLMNMICSHELSTQNSMDEHSVKTSKLLERIIEKSINFQQSYLPMIEILLCLLEKSHTSSQRLTERVLQKVKEAEASNNAFHKKLKENLTEFEQRYQQYYNEITEINEQTKDSLHEVSTFESQEQQKLNVLKQQINEINQTISQFEELKQRKNETQNTLSIYNDQRESLINKEKDFCQQYLENANEHSNKENEHEKVILQSINDEVVEITNLADKTQTETKEHTSILLNTMKDFTASLVSNVQEVNGQLVENIAKEIQHCQERSKLVEDKIKVAEVENRIDECSNKMENTEDDFNEHMNILRSRVNESTHTDTITSILKDTNGIKETAQSYFETFVDDVPTGKTPQRQTYTYPVNLAKTSPHEKILQKYRSRNELESALNLPLPDDSDLVNDENIKPLNLSLLSDCSEKNETEQKENDSSKELNRSKIPSLSRSRCKNDRRPLRIHNQSN